MTTNLKAWFFLAVFLPACSSEPPSGDGDDNGDSTGDDSTGDESGDDPHDELMDPETCQECHPVHYEEWLGSMHAYAADDPVFLAMNARGQRETNGELGDFCVKCHAPLAVALGATEDGLNLAELPQWMKGVNCYFCHQVTDAPGVSNNPLVLAMDDVMRGAVVDPVASEAHESEYGRFQDGNLLASGFMCGSCHDIVNPNGVHIERTHDEWLKSFYSEPDPVNPQYPDEDNLGQTCNNCHMSSRPDGPIADAPGVSGDRIPHDHRMAGVDVALTPFPDAERAPALQEAQREAIAEFRRTTLCASLCVREAETGGQELVVWLHNEFAGHGWPSGAMQDRRAWVEVIAKRGGEVVYQSGVVADGEPVAHVDDPDLWQFRDWHYDNQDNEVHMFWETEKYTSSQLPVAATFFADPQTWREKSYFFPGEPPDEVSMRVLLRPMGLEVLDDLIDSGDLDPAIRDRIETFSIPPVELTWTPDTAIESNTGYGTCFSSNNDLNRVTCRSPYIYNPE